MEFSNFKNTDEATNTESGLITEGKDTNDIDEIVLKNHCKVIDIIFFVFLFPFMSILFLFKSIIIIDSKNKRIIQGYEIYMVV